MVDNKKRNKVEKKPNENAQLPPARRNTVLSNHTLRPLPTGAQHVPQLAALAAIDTVL